VVKRGGSSMKAKYYVLYTLMWLILITTAFFTCGRSPEPEEAIIITEKLIMFDSDHYVILPQEPDTLTFVILGAIDDNTIEIYCIEDSTTQTMIVESAYTPEYYEGITFTMIKGQ
jgi:hypothetical protein